MRHNRTLTLTLIICLSTLCFAAGQSTPIKHASKKTTHSPQAQIASAKAQDQNALVQPNDVINSTAMQPLVADTSEIGDQEKNELYDKEVELGKAEEAKQTAFFQQNLTPNFMFVAFNGLVLSKDEILHALSRVQVSACEIRNVRFRRLDHNVIQLAYDLFMNGDIAGQAMPHQQYATSIWVKEGGNWMLAYHQTTPAHHR